MVGCGPVTGPIGHGMPGDPGPLAGGAGAGPAGRAGAGGSDAGAPPFPPPRVGAGSPGRDAVGSDAARWPWGGVTGAVVTCSVVSIDIGSVMVAVMPLPGVSSRWTRMPWRAARLPAT
jgi:hypothetical protein